MALSSLSSHLRGHSQGSSSFTRPVPHSLESADWSGQLGTSAFAQSLLGEALLDSLALPGEISAVAVDPVQGYLAVGTQSGTVHLYGSPAVHLSWQLRPTQPVKVLLFKPGTPLLVCADSKENLSIYDLSRPDPAAQAKSHVSARRGSLSQGGNYLQPHPDTPTRVAAYVARNSITTLHLSPSHAHLLVGLRDGTVDTYDLDRLNASPYRVPNCWYEEEELLRKSGVPDAPPRRHVPLVVDLAISPKDLNQLLLAYEGGAVLLDIKERVVTASFQLRLLPGAPGAGGISPEAMWTERGSPVTCIAWRPDGHVFAMGHEDGLISFWSPMDDGKPLLVRSLAEIDLDKPTVDELGFRPPREPIFKMSWAGFPGKGWFDALSGEKKAEDVSQADIEAGATLLTVLGGAVAGQDPPGVAILNFPPYTPPLAQTTTSSFWGGSTQQPAPDVVSKTRQSLRTSLSTSRESRLLSNGVVQDYVLLPRSSPHYGMAWDPCAIIMLTDIPSGLPPLAPPSAQRGLFAATFPPLPPPGFHGGKSTSSATIPSTSDVPGSAGLSPSTRPDYVAPKLLSLPFSLASSGAGAILGGQIIDLAPHNYRKLVGLPIEHDGKAETGHEDKHFPLPLRGGIAAAGVVGSQTPESLARAPGGFRILITHHLDGSVRFADVSQHLLLLLKAGPTGNAHAQDHQHGPPAPQFLDRSFPSPLPHLTISVTSSLFNPQLSSHRVSRMGQLRISSVHFATDVLEASVVLRGGAVVHYRFGHARFSQTHGMDAELHQETLREREGAEQAAHQALDARLERKATTASSHHGHEHQMLSQREDLELGAQLEDEMTRAMRDLDVSRAGTPSASPSVAQTQMPMSASRDSLGPPPPRPKRDPKRLSVMRRLRRGGNDDDKLTTTDASEWADSAAPSPVSPSQHSNRLSGPPETPFNATSAPHPSHGDAGEHAFGGEEFTSLEEFNDWSVEGFKAHLLIDLGRGEVTNMAHSDIGFLAMSCGAGLAVVDLRGPELLLREGMGDDFSVTAPDEGRGKGRARRSDRKLLEAESKAPITSLAWSICRLPGAQPASHAVLAPRLVVARSNGLLTTWTLVHTLSMWMPERTGAVKAEELETHEGKLTRGVQTGLQILDIAGNEARAVPSELQRSIREFGRVTGTEEMLEADTPLLLGWHGQTMFIRTNLLGARLSKVDTSETILSASIVDRNMEKVVVAVSESSIRVYSAPRLELIQRIQRHGHDHGERTTTETAVSIDKGGAGLFLQISSSLDVRLWTFFSQAPRACQPALLLHTWKPMPAHPSAGAVSSITSWFSSKAATTNPLDDIFAGPERPEAPKLPPPKTKEAFVAAITGTAEVSAGQRPGSAATAPSPRAGAGSNYGPHATAATVAETQETANVMGWNLDLARRRGEAMQGLENSLASLENSANAWVKESKAALVKSAAKDKLAKFGL